jgi:hypothetical protein
MDIIVQLRIDTNRLIVYRPRMTWGYSSSSRLWYMQEHHGQDKLDEASSTKSID